MGDVGSEPCYTIRLILMLRRCRGPEKLAQIKKWNPRIKILALHVWFQKYPWEIRESRAKAAGKLRCPIKGPYPTTSRLINTTFSCTIQSIYSDV